MTYTGSCLCGAIKFQIDAKDPLPFGHCHCGACRKSHGADFTSATILPDHKLILLHGEDSLATYQSSESMERQFCRNCGARMFVRFLRRGPEGSQVFYTVSINALDNIEHWRETAHIYVDHKAPWCTIKDDLPKTAENFPSQ